MSMESSALLYLNIILNVFAAAYALVMLLMRRGILQDVSDDDKGGETVAVRTGVMRSLGGCL